MREGIRAGFASVGGVANRRWPACASVAGPRKTAVIRLKWAGESVCAGEQLTNDTYLQVPRQIGKSWEPEGSSIPPFRPPDLAFSNLSSELVPLTAPTFAFRPSSSTSLRFQTHPNASPKQVAIFSLPQF